MDIRPDIPYQYQAKPLKPGVRTEIRYHNNNNNNNNNNNSKALQYLGCTKKTERDEGGKGQDDLSESKLGMKNSKKYLKIIMRMR